MKSKLLTERRYHALCKKLKLKPGRETTVFVAGMYAGGATVAYHGRQCSGDVKTAKFWGSIERMAQRKIRELLRE